jgi:hypothetical protein
MGKPETPQQREVRIELEKLTAALLKKIVLENQQHLPPNTGFALFLFDYGSGGNMAYASTGNRKDMVRAMREWLSHVED